MQYKDIIGQVILDKNPAIRTVITKVGEIQSTFRVFKMELIAGENDMIASVVSQCIKRDLFIIMSRNKVAVCFGSIIPLFIGIRDWKLNIQGWLARFKRETRFVNTPSKRLHTHVSLIFHQAMYLQEWVHFQFLPLKEDALFMRTI